MSRDEFRHHPLSRSRHCLETRTQWEGGGLHKPLHFHLSSLVAVSFPHAKGFSSL